jgi:hypothetical protein
MRSATLILLMAAGVANAGVVTIDAAAFPTGTDITSATPGVTLQALNNEVASGYVLNPVYAVANPGYLDAGPNWIGHGTGSSFHNASYQATSCFVDNSCANGSPTSKINVLLMSFQYPTNLVELRAHKDGNGLDWSYLRLYNKQKDLLASCYVPGTTKTQFPYYVPKILGFMFPCGELLRYYDCSHSGTSCKVEFKVRMTRSYPDIAYAIWGDEGYDSTPGYVNKISFRQFGDCAP